MSDTDIDNLFQAMDVNEGGSIELQEFTNFMSRTPSFNKSSSSFIGDSCDKKPVPEANVSESTLQPTSLSTPLRMPKSQLEHLDISWNDVRSRI